MIDVCKIASRRMNLLSNAIKASPKGSSVSVTATSSNGKEAIFSVEDKGVGIAQKYTPGIFGKYSQFHAREKGLVAGSGLGLNFCKLAVRELGGRIWVESQENKGTKVSFILPNKVI